MTTRIGGKPETVTRLAAAYGVNPILGLVAIGLITESDARSYRTPFKLEAVRNDFLMVEMIRRLKAARDRVGSSNSPLDTGVHNQPERKPRLPSGDRIEGMQTLLVRNYSWFHFTHNIAPLAPQ